MTSFALVVVILVTRADCGPVRFQTDLGWGISEATCREMVDKKLAASDVPPSHGNPGFSIALECRGIE